MKLLNLLIVYFLTVLIVFSQETKVKHIKIGTTSIPENSEVKLALRKRFQHYNASPGQINDIYDNTIYSPKSVNILNDKNKFYVHSLEGFSTSVYNLKTLELIKVIKHQFNTSNINLFKDTSVFNYKFSTINSNYNIFKGKPVESCLSHNGKYLWVTYYRRSYDLNAVDPSAVAIIETDTDEIVRVMPTGPLPKMIASSKDNKYVAVTHWGDNTVGIIDISSEDPEEFFYTEHFVVGKQIILDYGSDKKVDRDHGCGYCLRGTVFSPDSKYLFVGKMGGKAGIAVFDMESKKYLKSISGMHNNLRHLAINNNELYISTNVTGFVERTNINDFIDFIEDKESSVYNNWISKYVGIGIRTIVVSSDGKYIFATVNNESKIVVIRSSDMKIISSIDADSFPVGMAIDKTDKFLIVTSQGKAKYGGGHSVMVFNIEF